MEISQKIKNLNLHIFQLFSFSRLLWLMQGLLQSHTKFRTFFFYFCGEKSYLNFDGDYTESASCFKYCGHFNNINSSNP